ncbi:MAG: winged helix-turn-helix domain-containing protein, partial [Ilumatobacteraceae bacterium]
MSPTCARIDGTSPLALFKVLGDDTRYAIYRELVLSPRPLSTVELSATVGLHPNTVRPHLDKMREVGLVEVRPDDGAEVRRRVGRPRHRYQVAAG